MKKKKLNHLISLILLSSVFASCTDNKNIDTDVLVIGGTTSGISAGIQSARLGVETLVIEETGWLGGMLTAAGVSGTDGNHNLHSGIRRGSNTDSGEPLKKRELAFLVDETVRPFETKEIGFDGRYK